MIDISNLSTNEATRFFIIERLEKQQEKLATMRDRLVRYAILGEPCTASDSLLATFDCWCAECKEITSTIIKYDLLPEWLIN